MSSYRPETPRKQRRTGRPGMVKTSFALSQAALRWGGVCRVLGAASAHSPGPQFSQRDSAVLWAPGATRDMPALWLHSACGSGSFLCCSQGEASSASRETQVTPSPWGVAFCPSIWFTALVGGSVDAV